MRVGDALFADAGVGVEVEFFDGGLRNLPRCGIGGGRGRAGFLVGFGGCGERCKGEGEDGAGQREERGRARSGHRVVPPGRMIVGTKNIRCWPQGRRRCLRTAAPVARFCLGVSPWSPSGWTGERQCHRATASRARGAPSASEQNPSQEACRRGAEAWLRIARGDHGCACTPALWPERSNIGDRG